MMTAAEIADRLAMHTGTETWTKHALMPTMLMTDGILDLREIAECHWLIDAIASYMADRRLQREEFRAWTFKRGPDDVAPANQPHVLVCTDGGVGGAEPRRLVQQEITVTDFPLSSIDLWLIKAPEFGPLGYVLMLPSEY